MLIFFSLLRWQGNVLLKETYKESHIQVEGKGKSGFMGASLYHRSIAQKVKHLETTLCAVVMSEKCLVLAGGCVFTMARKFRTQELP